MIRSDCPKLLAELVGTFCIRVHRARRRGRGRDGPGLNSITCGCFAHGLAIMALAFAMARYRAGISTPPSPWACRRGAMKIGEAFAYIVSQLIGGVTGALMLLTVPGRRATGLGVPALAQSRLGAATVDDQPETLS